MCVCLCGSGRGGSVCDVCVLGGGEREWGVEKGRVVGMRVVRGKDEGFERGGKRVRGWKEGGIRV